MRELFLSSQTLSKASRSSSNLHFPVHFLLWMYVFFNCTPFFVVVIRWGGSIAAQ